MNINIYTGMSPVGQAEYTLLSVYSDVFRQQYRYIIVDVV